MSEEIPEDVQRWTSKRRAALVFSILKGETSVQEAARKHGLTVAEIEDWRERFLLAAENVLRSRPKDEEALEDERIKKLEHKIGELVLDMDILKEGVRPSPFGPQDVRRVLSIIVGVSQRRACSVPEVSRSVLHGRPPRETQRAGGDELLRARIARLIEQHPTFGYRRIWALLRFGEKVLVYRKTVYGVLRRQQWFVHQRRITPRPRLRGWRSQTEHSDQRWAMDVTHIPCGGDGWGSFGSGDRLS